MLDYGNPQEGGRTLFALIRHDLDEATREASSTQNVDELPTDAIGEHPWCSPARYAQRDGD
jgi:hypothetical protein